MFDKYKDDLIRLLLWALLISSLVATITNLAWAFSVVSPLGSKAAWFGAISFDGAVLIISFYARRFEHNSYPRHLARSIVITNTVISIYANVYRAIEFQRPLERINGAAWYSMPIVLGFALPLLTWALAEILVLDETKRTDEFERKRKRETQVARKATMQDIRQLARPTNKAHNLDRDSRKDLVIQAILNNRHSHRAIANYSGISRGSISNLINELKSEGRIIIAESGQLEVLAEPKLSQSIATSETTYKNQEEAS